MHLAGACAWRCAPSAHVLARTVFQDAGRDGGAVRRLSRGAAQRRGDRAALRLRVLAGQEPSPRLPDARRGIDRGLSARAGEGGAGETPAAPVPGGGGAQRGAAALFRAPRLRDCDDHPDGVPRLLPDRRRLHQLGPRPRRPGRSGTRLRSGLAGGLFARHHRPRPAAIRIAVRAFPQPGTGVDARLRHRLLPGRPRPRDRVREAEVRRRERFADRDLRDDGGEGGGARRRPRARHALRRGGPHRQARALRARHHAEEGDRRRAGVEADDPGPGGGARIDGSCAGARGTHAQRRHACRRRADRARASSPTSPRSTWRRARRPR